MKKLVAYVVFAFFSCNSAVIAKATQPALADIIEPLLPTVVRVFCTNARAKNFSEYKDTWYNNPLDFDSFFKDIPDKKIVFGSGVIIDPAGYIVTNQHVIADMDEIKVTMHDNIEYAAKLVGSDKETDLALLKIDAPQPLPHSSFDDFDKSRVGDQVILIGNPHNYVNTVTTGIISFKGRDLNNDLLVDNLIQTDAAMNHGNSGGPMFNLDGKIIGINTSITSDTGSSIGLGFAIPASVAKDIISRLRQDKSITRGMLNVELQKLTPAISEGLGFKEIPEGLLVVNVIPNGNADKCGIKAGDIINQFNGTIVNAVRKLKLLVSSIKMGSVVKTVVLRNGSKIDLMCKFEKDSVSETSTLAASSKMNESLEIEGVKFSALTKDLIKTYNISDEHLSKGIIVVSVALQSPWKTFLQPGDILLTLNNNDISITLLKKLYLNSKSKYLTTLIHRQNDKQYVALPIAQR